jgi:creatinine amidohydrolase
MPVAYLPLGTLEWHGEHMPLGADALQSTALFELAASRYGGIVVPPLFLGPDIRDADDLIGMDTSPNPDPSAQYPKQQFTGSAYWVPDALFVQILEATLAQLKRAGFRAIIAHGHGPSTNTYVNNSERWSQEFGLQLLTLRGPLDHEGLGYMADHAATNETSITMRIHPEMVDISALDGQNPLLGIWGEDPRVHASVEFGEKLINLHLERIGELLQAASLR